MKLPVLSDENETLPVGLVGAADVSVTVAVHGVTWLIMNVLSRHDMLVLVWCAWTCIVTVRLNASLLAV